MVAEQETVFSDNPEYDAFVEKFKPKKTTDDCYTPPYIYEAVLRWAVNEYGLSGRTVVRPFYPGGDYERFNYPDGCVVIDNPPFSILAKILNHYKERKIDFFLFAPALTVLSSCGNKCNAVISDSSIIYENGANVKTAFVTNMGAYKVHVSAALYKAIDDAQTAAQDAKRVELPKYIYPDEILTAATIQKIARYGQTLKIPAAECAFVRTLDAQRLAQKRIYGGGMLLSEKAAAEKAAAEKCSLSDRERAIVRGLGHADI